MHISSNSRTNPHQEAIELIENEEDRVLHLDSSANLMLFANNSCRCHFGLKADKLQTVEFAESAGIVMEGIESSLQMTL